MKRTVKAWAVLNDSGNIFTWANGRTEIYVTKKGTKWAESVYPCTITINQRRPTNGKR